MTRPIINHHLRNRVIFDSRQVDMETLTEEKGNDNNLSEFEGYVTVYFYFSSLTKQEKKGLLTSFFDNHQVDLQQFDAKGKIFLDKSQAIFESQYCAEPHVIVKAGIESSDIVSKNEQLKLHPGSVKLQAIYGVYDVSESPAKFYKNPFCKIQSNETNIS